jgi:hypothetical protein
MLRMTKTSLFVPLFLLAAIPVANAGGQPGSLGVGAEAQLSGITGISANYDAGKFHVGGVLGYYDPAGRDNSTFEIGGRFYYHVHSTAMADFGLGAGLGFASVPAFQGLRSERGTLVYIEPGFQTRLFVASNVALSFTAGFLIGVADASDPTESQLASGLEITGQFNGIAGVHYYFF